MSYNLRNFFRSIISIVLSVCFTNSLFASTIRYVDVNASGPTHDGSSWCSAFTDLQDALVFILATDEIRIADGTYRPDRGTGNRELSFQLKSGVRIYGGYAGCNASNPDARNITSFETILSGDLAKNDSNYFLNYSDNSYHVVAAVNVDDTGLLDGVTVSGGNADGPNFGPDPSSKDQGSGINNYWSTARYENCTLRLNFSSNHGAFNDHGGATLINCTLEDNESGMWGGGLFVAPHIATTVTGCKFINNRTGGSAGGGGAIANGGDSTFTDCTMTGNTSDTHGGGIYIHNSSNPKLIRCTVSNGFAIKRGGGIYVTGNSAPELIDCILSDNSSNRGGAFYNTGNSNPILHRCKIVRNFTQQAPGENALSGAGVYNEFGNPIFTECQFLENNTTSYGGAFYDSRQTNIAIFSYCLFKNNIAGTAAGLFGRIVHMDHCVITQNLAHFTAPALKILSQQSTITNCIISHNTVLSGNQVNGIVVTTGSADVVFTNCIFSNNESIKGGALLNISAKATLVNCLFTGNSAEQGGAVMNIGGYNFEPTLSVSAITNIINCIMVGNQATHGNAIASVIVGDVSSSQINVVNSILWNGGKEIWDDGSSAITHNISYSDVWGGWPGIGNIDLDPMFTDPDGPDDIFGNDDDNLRPLSSSPTINKGLNSALPIDIPDLDGDGIIEEQLPLDLDGNKRILSGLVDMGAYEQADCNNNGIPDELDISGGTSQDCTGNEIPDECEPDCNNNTIADSCDIASVTSEDCNTNSIPDVCDIASNPELDCNTNNIPDTCDIASGTTDDCNGNAIPDLCDLINTPTLDCNNNQIPDTCDIAEGTSQDINGNNIPDICDQDCNNNGVPDGFDIIEGTSTDCNTNIIPDECEMNNMYIVDCNGNNVLDECDIADGTSFDVNDNCIPDECNQTPMPLAEEFPIHKNRFISFIPVNAGCSTAIRITLSSLHHPDPPLPDSPDFTEFEGQVRWAGSPNTFVEGGASEVMFWASSLQCEPYFTDWSQVNMLHLFGDAVIPSSTYRVEVVGDDCFDLNDPNCYSDALEVSTGRWGDVEAPFQSVGGPNQPTIDDVLANVRKWLGSLKPVKVQSILHANAPNPSEGVSVDDVLQVVNAWLSAPYPYAGPAICPP